jgi:hypothetical protein
VADSPDHSQELHEHSTLEHVPAEVVMGDVDQMQSLTGVVKPQPHGQVAALVNSQEDAAKVAAALVAAGYDAVIRVRNGRE